MNKSSNKQYRDQMESHKLSKSSDNNAKIGHAGLLHKDSCTDVEAHMKGISDDDDDEEEMLKEECHKEQDFDDDGEEDSQKDQLNVCVRVIRAFRNSLGSFVRKNRTTFQNGGLAVGLLIYFVYFAFSMRYSFGDEDSLRLLGITCFLVLVIFVKLIQKRRRHVTSVSKTWQVTLRRISAKLRLLQICYVLLSLAFILYVIVVIARYHPRNLLSLAGIIFFVLAFYVCSCDPAKVQWRTVFWGLLLQILLALAILKTTWGQHAFNWMGERVKEFLSHTDEGSRFVFGEAYTQHHMAFKVFPVIVFFGMIVSMLYHVGALQVVILTMGRFLAFLLETSPTESISAAANIFIGMTEAPLIVAPYLNDMTDSEIHCIMSGGFATIAGGIMATYIMFKIPANHLISASVMSAPAALVMSKLLYPELKRNKKGNTQNIKSLAKSEARNLLEAATNGAVMTVKLIANVVVNLIAFMALLHFINSSLDWLGRRCGYHNFSFQLICSYLFWPLALLMGVDYQDCLVMAELVGIKTFVNEFMAYVELSKFINNRNTFEEYLANASALNLTGAWMQTAGGDIYLNDTAIILHRGIISHRTIVIATYALCGFANFGSIGIQIGGLGALAPRRRSDLAKLGLSAMMAGNVACFMTACVAGLLYSGDE